MKDNHSYFCELRTHARQTSSIQHSLCGLQTSELGATKLLRNAHTHSGVAGGISVGIAGRVIANVIRHQDIRSIRDAARCHVLQVALANGHWLCPQECKFASHPLYTVSLSWAEHCPVSAVCNAYRAASLTTFANDVLLDVLSILIPLHCHR